MYFKATGNVLLTDSYNTDMRTSDQYDDIHTLYKYWEIRDGKYRLVEADVILDEYYFGDIVITGR